MDFEFFIANKASIECGEKPGLYIVMQANQKPELQWYRMGLAGKPVDSATQFKSKSGNFSTRFAQYLNYWGPTGAKVYACLTVPRVTIQGFAERIMPSKNADDGREDYALLHTAKTLIQRREKEMHSYAVQYGMERWKMATSLRATSEFFKGSLAQAIKSMRSVGVGTMFTFHGNNINSIRKQTLTRGDIIIPDHIKLRESPRLVVQQEVVDLLQKDDPGTKRAIERLSGLKTKPKTATAPVVFAAKEKDIAKVGVDKRVTRAMARLGEIRRSPRFA